ncbi:hypothetical protein V1515DRAFT_582465 [Lipomyces mesembrius]
MKHRRLPASPVASPSAVVGGTGNLRYRFTVLASGLVRFEYSLGSVFEDRASTLAINRNLPVPSFRVVDREDGLEIITERFHLRYDKQLFSANGLRVQVRGDVTNYTVSGGTVSRVSWRVGTLEVQPGHWRENIDMLSCVDIFSEGSIIPVDAAKTPGNGGKTPESLEVIVVVGRDGSFDIYEDDGNGSGIEDVDFVHTPLSYIQDIGTLSIGPVVTKAKSVVGKRDWTFSFLMLDSVKIAVEGPATAKLEIVLGDNAQLAVTDASKHIFRLLNDACMLFDVKQEVWSVVTAPIPLSSRLTRLNSLDLNARLLGAL